MKRFASLITIFGMLFVACDKEQEPFEKPDTIAVESVVVTPASCELTVDGEETLSVEVLPADAEYSIEWITTNSDIVTVADGTIRGIAPGTAIVITSSSSISPAR